MCMGPFLDLLLQANDLCILSSPIPCCLDCCRFSKSWSHTLSLLTLVSFSAYTFGFPGPFAYQHGSLLWFWLAVCCIFRTGWKELRTFEYGAFSNHLTLLFVLWKGPRFPTYRLSTETIEIKLKSKGDVSGAELICQLRMQVQLDCTHEPQGDSGGLGLFKADANTS